MKKRMITAIGAAVLTMGILAGCGSAQDIGRDAALEAALQDAGVSESDATRLLVSEERDDGRKVYEIRFDVAEKEYDYEIQASDGKIISSEVDTNRDYTVSASQSNESADGTTESAGAAGTAESGTNGTGGTQNSAEAVLSMEEAVQIALERVPGAGQQDIRIELDRDDGKYKYEGEIIYNQTEYDFEIDANTGTVLEWSEERV